MLNKKTLKREVPKTREGRVENQAFSQLARVGNRINRKPIAPPPTLVETPNSTPRSSMSELAQGMPIREESRIGNEPQRFPERRQELVRLITENALNPINTSIFRRGIQQGEAVAAFGTEQMPSFETQRANMSIEDLSRYVTEELKRMFGEEAFKRRYANIIQNMNREQLRNLLKTEKEKREKFVRMQENVIKKEKERIKAMKILRYSIMKFLIT